MKESTDMTNIDVREALLASLRADLTAEFEMDVPVLDFDSDLRHSLLRAEHALDACLARGATLGDVLRTADELLAEGGNPLFAGRKLVATDGWLDRLDDIPMERIKPDAEDCRGLTWGAWKRKQALQRLTLIDGMLCVTGMAAAEDVTTLAERVALFAVGISGRPCWPGDLPRAPADRRRPGEPRTERGSDVGEEGDAAPVRGRAEDPEVRLDQLVEEPGAEEEPGRQLHREDDHEPAHRRVRVEDEVGAEHGGDRAARAQVGHPRLGRAAEGEGHQRLRQRRDEAAREVEDELAERAEGVLDVLAKDGQEEHVAEDVVPASVQEHRGDPADSPVLGAVAAVVDRAGIEGRMEHGVAQVRQLVEQPDREVGDDDRNIDDREAPRSQPIGERKHPSSLSPASPSGVHTDDSERDVES
jgi:hypothetical protein